MTLDSNIAALFFRQAKKNKNKTAIEHRKKRNESYKQISWEEYSNLVSYFAMGLVELGVEKGDRVAIISDTRYEWSIADLACLTVGAIVVTVYPTLPEPQVEYILNNAEVKIVIAENKGQFQKIRGQWEKLPYVKKVIVIDDFGDLPENEPRIISFENLISSGKQNFSRHPNFLNQFLVNIHREDTATIIYTSGTTGPPKGVVLTHNNLLSVVEVLPKILPVKDNDKFLSFLPLSHVFERVGCFHYAISCASTISFCSNIDQIGKSLIDSKATVMCVVPRLLEKMYEKTESGIKLLPDSKRNLIYKALSISKTYYLMSLEKRYFSLKFLIYKILNSILKTLILSKIKNKISPTIKCFISGGAPLSPSISEFFYLIGIPILEGYGLTETSAPATVNTIKDLKIGTVGKPIYGIEVKIASDGEILIKGASVFKEYYKNPDATKEAFINGYFKSGDIGIIDEDGFVKITDRKKDLIVNSSGKNIPPQIIENSIKTSPYINSVVVIGDKRKYLSALITLNSDAIIKFANEHGLDVNKDTVHEIYNSELITQLISEEIKLKTASFADYEQIIKFKIIPTDFSVASGELTPTLKVKRKFVESKYKDLIDSMY